MMINMIQMNVSLILKPFKKYGVKTLKIVCEHVPVIFKCFGFIIEPTFIVVHYSMFAIILLKKEESVKCSILLNVCYYFAEERRISKM